MKITWLGHAAFRYDFAGKAVLIDPFLTHNPTFKGDVAEVARGVDHILLTHGHGDHIGDTVSIVKAAEAEGRTITVVANPELCYYLGGQGLTALAMMGLGGVQALDGFTVAMVRADHTSGSESPTPVYLGTPSGLIVTPTGGPGVWHLGDTDIFSDMALISEIHKPKVAIVPIGDRFTMGPRTAALAVQRFIDVETVIPCHYGTFPLLVPDASRFVAALEGHPVKVLVPKSGESVEV
ncbi:UPF0173 metal-dependent hydrolase [Azorhizobium oxalatiphilum]|uniref:UPF0173 metal-dependent hydrolase GCM10007301_13890 n=1 Tax=Azorhizobium oxalatiphilum TaxID=980631 RepID=A0A917BSS1_9HYPH|nr:metal-dependent hydrolase [Azorhizobium oxalatiphilum]GGF55482.1 UPF0173 metal-dependent hydrolase [Azorhizobium oxalatiphilum]